MMKDMNRHRTNAIVVILTVFIVSMTVLFGALLQMPEEPEGACHDMYMDKYQQRDYGEGFSNRTICNHSEQVMSVSRSRCIAVGGDIYCTYGDIRIIDDIGDIYHYPATLFKGVSK